MQHYRAISFFAAAVTITASLAVGSPVVTISTTANIASSGYDAIDFYYASTDGADFTNYRLNLETTGGGFIYDPLQNELQNMGSSSIDTYMNTVGSYLGISNATHIQNTYKPSGPGADGSSISRIDWSVFDTLSEDSNAIDGFSPGPYHLARVLISPNSQWNASFAAFDTASNGMAATWRFTSNSSVGTMDPIIPPASVIQEPIVSPPPSIPPVSNLPPQSEAQPPWEAGQPADSPAVSPVPDNSITTPILNGVVELPLVTGDPLDTPGAVVVVSPSWPVLHYRLGFAPTAVWNNVIAIDTIATLPTTQSRYSTLAIPISEDATERIQLQSLFARSLMFDGADFVPVSYVATDSGGSGKLAYTFISAQDSGYGPLGGATPTPEPTAALMAAAVLTASVHILARKRRAAGS